MSYIDGIGKIRELEQAIQRINAAYAELDAKYQDTQAELDCAIKIQKEKRENETTSKGNIEVEGSLEG